MGLGFIPQEISQHPVRASVKILAIRDVTGSMLIKEPVHAHRLGGFNDVPKMLLISGWAGAMPLMRKLWLRPELPNARNLSSVSLKGIRQTSGKTAAPCPVASVSAFRLPAPC